MALGNLNIVTPAPHSPALSTFSGSISAVKQEAVDKRDSMRTLNTLLDGAAKARSQLDSKGKSSMVAAHGKPAAAPELSQPRGSKPSSSCQSAGPQAATAPVAAPAPASTEPAPASTEPAPAQPVAAAKNEPSGPNSQTHKAMWMQCQRASMSKTGKVSNEWTNKWKSGGAERAQLFKLFFEREGNVKAVEVMMQRERAGDFVHPKPGIKCLTVRDIGSCCLIMCTTSCGMFR